MSLFSAFRNGPSKPEEPAQMSTQMPGQQQQAQQAPGPAKAIPMGHPSPAHPAPPQNHHEGATDLDLYRTFSPTDVGMWSWEAGTGGPARTNSASMWTRLFGK